MEISRQARRASSRGRGEHHAGQNARAPAGQRQLLSFARAIVCNASILVLEYGPALHFDPPGVLLPLFNVLLLLSPFALAALIRWICSR